jgi:hypothetical protein
MEKYRDVVVRSDFRLTSQNPGQGHSSTEAGSLSVSSSENLVFLENDTIVSKIMKQMNVDETRAKSLFQDVQRFLWMSSKTDDPSIPSPTIDDAWHEFILFTREYAEFCKKNCGRFIHHEPHTGDVASEVDVLTLHPTIDLMHSVFGEKPTPDWDFIPSREMLPNKAAA